MAGIYKITNPKGKSYIGLSKNITQRWDSYKVLNFQSNTLLKESLQIYGFENHTFEIVEECNEEMLRDREKHYISLFNTFYDGLNSNKGGSGCDFHTEESKLKIGEANSIPKPKNFGVNRSKDFYTDEWRKKISESNKGVSRNKGRISPTKGKIMSEEQKQKISNANKGKSKPKDFMIKRKKKVLHINSNTIYDSITQAAKELNLPYAGVSQCCSGKRKSTKGNTFKIVN